MHVADGIDGDERSDDHDDEEHHGGQWVDEEPELDGEISDCEPFYAVFDRIVHGCSAAEDFQTNAGGNDEVDSKDGDDDANGEIFTAAGKEAGNGESKERQ